MLRPCPTGPSRSAVLAFTFTCAGAMAQNVYLFSASAGLATVVRAWFDHAGLSEAMGLSADHELLLTQTVGHPAS